MPSLNKSKMRRVIYVPCLPVIRSHRTQNLCLFLRMACHSFDMSIWRTSIAQLTGRLYKAGLMASLGPSHGLPISFYFWLNSPIWFRSEFLHFFFYKTEKILKGSVVLVLQAKRPLIWLDDRKHAHMVWFKSTIVAVSWWPFTRVWVTASLLKSSGLFWPSQ